LPAHLDFQSMKAILVLFDSLNRRWLEPYGGEPGVPTPNFARLAKKTITLDTSYVCSMPCMPARRDLLTGRPGFLHRGWGPMEPFDDCFTGVLASAGVHSHLVTDHYHYFEEGGRNYHTKYSTWEFNRGQEGDPWKPRLDDAFEVPPNNNHRGAARIRQDFANRTQASDESSHWQTRTFDSGLEFLDRHHDTDNWYLQIETFDPHEPFFAPESWRQRFSPDYDGPVDDWPDYGDINENEGMRERMPQLRREYAALLSLCDHSLGRVLDLMDRHDLWKDTMLLVGTDHGFLLGEHDFCAKNVMPVWEEIGHTPLFVWDPRVGCAGERRKALTQTIDWGPTLLEFFGQAVPPDMTGLSLRPVIEDDTPIRDAGIFGWTNHYLNVTDGRYVFMKANDPAFDENVWSYTLAPAEMARPMPLEKLRGGEPAPPLPFGKGAPMMRYPSEVLHRVTDRWGDLLYDVVADPLQRQPLADSAQSERLTRAALGCMKEAQAPEEQYRRLGWEPPA
jgi:arylsulfatase A-like enzyme